MSTEQNTAQVTESAKVYTYENDFAEFVRERSTGKRLEIDEEMFYYWLEVLPPAFMQRETTLADGTRRWVSFGFAEGPERVTAFWGKDGKFFAQYCNEVGRS